MGDDKLWQPYVNLDRNLGYFIFDTEGNPSVTHLALFQPYPRPLDNPIFTIRTSKNLEVWPPTTHSSFLNVLTKVPICGKISTLNSSPAWRFSLGFFPIPTPAGVPVIMTVPAGRVVPWDRKLISFGMLKIRSLYIVSG